MSLLKKEKRTIVFDQLIAFANDHSGVSVRKRILLSGNLLEGTGDDEVSMVHCNQVSCELAGEVVVILKFLPVKVRVGVLGFLECMGNCALKRKKEQQSHLTCRRNSRSLFKSGNDKTALGFV